MDDKLKMNGGALPRSRPASRTSYLFDRRPGASSFRGPPSVPESYRQWTQFSGMPTHAGSPSSLQQVLDSMDMPEVPSEYLFSSYSPVDGPRSAGVLPSESARTNHFENMHRSFSVNACPPQRQYTEQGWSTTGLSQPSRGQSFEFRSPDDFEFSLPNCQHLPSPSHSSHISASHSFHFPGMSSAKLPCSLATDQPQAFPTDLSQTSPSRNFFGSVIDFSCPPPLVNNSAFPSSSSDHCHPLQPKYLPSLSQHTTGSTVSCFTNEVRQKSAFVNDEDQSSSQEVPTADDYFRGHINMGMSSPRFIPFAGVGEVLHASEPQHTFVSDSLPSSPGFPKTPRKIIRQHSEPVVSSTQPRESECVYLEAVERSNSFGPSGDVLKPQAEDHKEKCVQPPESRLACENLQSKVRGVASKPSYSDVAKSAKPKDAQQKTDCLLGRERDDAEHTLPRRKNLEASGAKSHPKPSHKSHMHSKPNRAKSISDKGQVFVQPNSRYGLDHFEDVISNLARGRSHSSSAESLTSHHHHQHQHQHQHAEGASCKGSNRSVGSSPITVQEPQHGNRVKSGVTTASSQGGTGKHKEKSNDHDTTKMQSGGPSGGVGSHQPASSAAVPTATPKAKPNRPFFDPKRIFQTKESTGRTQGTGAQRVKGLGEALGFEEETIVKEMVLNNGKPNNNSNKVPSAAHKKADYINNDLRETGGASSSSSKRTNQTAALNRDSHFEHSKKAPAATPNSDSHAEQNGSSDSKKRGSGGHLEKLEPAAVVPHQKHHSLFDNFDWMLIDDWLKYFAARGQVFASSCFSAILTLLLYLFGIIMYLVTGMIHLMAVSIGKIWGLLKVKFFKVDESSNSTGGWGNAGSPDSRRRSGLEENITLPATGEEAMKRLLACKGKDPYSILGLRFDATDDDVKRYYRKQAVLVHPDKNQEPGAEEAFKILGHAFEMIGEPAKRKQYDAHILEASEAEAAMREFSDLLTKLQEKIQEAANMMRCEQCGGKHRRVPVDRPWCSARYCDRCNIHHTAKEGDVWAETSMLGFLWHYYACMEGNVYDITEWVSCQRENFKHMKANAHPVFYRIQTDGNRRQRSGQSGEAHLEDFINQLFNKASMQTDGFPHPDWHPPGAGNQSSWGGASASSGAKRTRRRKRKN